MKGKRREGLGLYGVLKRTDTRTRDTFVFRSAVETEKVTAKRRRHTIRNNYYKDNKDFNILLYRTVDNEV